MGLIDGIRRLGSGIASIPGKLNEARFTHATAMIPIGIDPDTGDPIEVSEEELRTSGMYNPASGQIVKPMQVRTGQSQFGNFLQNGLPKMVDAGIAAATAPGQGRGGFFEALRGMDIGQNRLDQRDMIAYNQKRQMQQDRTLEEERAARAAENRAQAELYRRRMEAPPAEPKAPTTWEASLVQMHQQAIAAGDMERANAIADQLNQLKKIGAGAGQYINPGGGAIFDTESKTWISQPKPPAEKPHQPKGTFWVDNGDGYETEHANTFNPNTNEYYSKPIEGTRRKKAVKSTSPFRRTPTQQDAIEAQRQANELLKEAGQDYDKALDLAKAKNAPLTVQGLIIDQKAKLGRANAAGRGRTTSGAPKLGGSGWKDAKQSIIGGKK